MKKPFSGLLSPDPVAKYAPAEPSPKEILVALYGLLMSHFLMGLFTALGALAAIWLIGGIQLRWNDESRDSVEPQRNENIVLPAPCSSLTESDRSVTVFHQFPEDKFFSVGGLGRNSAKFFPKRKSFNNLPHGISGIKHFCGIYRISRLSIQKPAEYRNSKG